MCLIPAFENGSGDLSILSKELLERGYTTAPAARIGTGINAGLFWTPSTMDTPQNLPDTFPYPTMLVQNGMAPWSRVFHHRRFVSGGLAKICETVQCWRRVNTHRRHRRELGVE